jgi:16S rRNA (cytidine1402-2'-O)-methyltransferase
VQPATPQTLQPTEGGISSTEYVHKEPGNGKGALYIVSTPIGNLQDITLRALDVLKEVDLIAAEDTRHTAKLLTAYQIRTKTTSYHDFNKERRTPELLKKLREGQNVAIVSDAGTPGISDPCYYLVTRAIKEDIPVIPIPGPTAAISALVTSGLATDRFVFEGFLPSKLGRARSRVAELAEETRTLIFYESPHRLLRNLKILSEILGDRRVALARELTKQFEEIQRDTLSMIMQRYETATPRGEFVLIVEGAGKDKKADSACCPES